MKASLFLIVFGMGLALPATGDTELETLRERCALQERQIQRLEAEIETLREGKSAPAAATGWTTPKASAPAKEDPTQDDPAKEDPDKEAPVKEDPDKEAPAKEIPAKAAPVMEAPAKAVPAGGSGYTVRAGDNLDKIARKNGTTAEKLAEANDLKLTSILQIGQKLVLPAKGKARSTTEPPATRKTDDPKPSKSSTAAEETPPASHAGTTPKTPPAAATKADTPPPAKTVDKKKTHAVKIESEMTYGEFAAKHGTDIRRLNDLNGLDLTKSAVLAKGSELYVPGQP